MSSKLNELLKNFVDEIVTGDGKTKKVVKTWPLTAAEKKTFNALVKQARDLCRQTEKMKADRNRLWADIQERLDEYGSSLHVNNEKGVIEKFEGSISEMCDEELMETAS